MRTQGGAPRVVIIGAGFAGVAAARALRKCNAEVVLIDRRNHHIFQPLLYQVATSVLAPAEIAAPIRQLGRTQANLSVMMGEVSKLELKARYVEAACPGAGVTQVEFDYLIIATGVQSSYFGHDEFGKYAPSLKTITDAEAIRAKILSAYERAELSDDPTERARQMTFVLVGAGATGVELAASIAQMATVTLRANFRRIDPATSSIVLLDGAPRVLPGFAESLSKRVAARLARLGVRIITGVKVEHLDEQGVIVGGERIDSATVLWTAGVAPSPIVKMLGAPTDRAGRACVGPFLEIAHDTRIFAIGDAAAVTQDGRPLPGVAQVAIQEGRYVGRFIAAMLEGRTIRRFRYFDKGSMAVVGKNFAILERGSVRLSGFIPWLIWALIHVGTLPQLQSRMRVQIQWLWSYFSGQRSSRLIPEPPRG
ncbi:MAG TPA: NAD(P)/FAD-dependent oxidoreductase [Steroidobacteraceae bacterium]|nr:NAD(P)/FAD-dependent oxidoreductase [Steroidobacteraceae bacterium]